MYELEKILFTFDYFSYTSYVCYCVCITEHIRAVQYVCVLMSWYKFIELCRSTILNPNMYIHFQYSICKIERYYTHVQWFHMCNKSFLSIFLFHSSWVNVWWTGICYGKKWLIAIINGKFPYKRERKKEKENEIEQAKLIYAHRYWLQSFTHI